MRPAGTCTGRAAAAALAAALAAQPGCGIAQRAGRGATEGAVGALADKVPDRAGLLDLTGDVKQRAAGSLLDKLNRPDQLEDLQQIAGAVAAGTISGAAQAAVRGAANDHGEAEATPIEAISEQAARVLSRQLLAGLGPSGQGPLATSLAATTKQVTGSVARGARGELAPFFPECREADPASCLDHAVERLSRAGSTGVAAGLGAALGGWPLILAFVVTFGVGALAAVTLVWLVSVARRPRRSASVGVVRARGLRARGWRSRP